MGNCCFCTKRYASKNMVWDSEESCSESPAPRPPPTKRRVGNYKVIKNNDVENSYVNVERKTLLDEERGFSSSPASYSREVKLKLTRKELEDLVQGVEVRGLSIEEVLAKLINGNAQLQVEYQRSWRPVLQSIPEVNSELSC